MRLDQHHQHEGRQVRGGRSAVQFQLQLDHEHNSEQFGDYHDGHQRNATRFYDLHADGAVKMISTLQYERGIIDMRKRVKIRQVKHSQLKFVEPAGAVKFEL